MFAASYSLLFLCLVLCCVAAVAAYTAVSAANRADGVGAELSASLRRFKTVQDSVLVLETRLDRLSGRVYAQARKPKPEPEDDGDGEFDSELAEALALQAAPPAQPGAKRRN